MTMIEQACIVQRSQARADLCCVNCGKTVGTPHKIMCYEGTKALRHVERHHREPELRLLHRENVTVATLIHALTTILGRRFCTCCWSGCDCGCADLCPLKGRA